MKKENKRNQKSDTTKKIELSCQVANIFEKNSSIHFEITKSMIEKISSSSKIFCDITLKYSLEKNKYYIGFHNEAKPYWKSEINAQIYRCKIDLNNHNLQSFKLIFKIRVTGEEKKIDENLGILKKDEMIIQNN